MKSLIKKKVFLSLVCLCLAGDSYGTTLADREEDVPRSPSSPLPYLDDDRVDRSGADSSGAYSSEDEEAAAPGQLKRDTIFGKLIQRKKSHRFTRRALSPVPDEADSDYEGDYRKKGSSKKEDSFRVDPDTVATFRSRIEDAVAYVNTKKWANSVQGQQAKYEALLDELREDELSDSEKKDLTTLTDEDRQILKEAGVSSDISADPQSDFENDAQGIVGEFNKLKGGSSKTEIAPERERPVDEKARRAFRKYVDRIASEVDKIKWLPSVNEQKDKFNTFVGRLKRVSAEAIKSPGSEVLADLESSHTVRL